MERCDVSAAQRSVPAFVLQQLTICPVSCEQLQSLDETFLRDAVMERLQDDVPEVVVVALKLLQVSGLMMSAVYVPYTAVCSLWLFFRCCWVFWTQGTPCHVCCLCCTERIFRTLSGGQ